MEHENVARERLLRVFRFLQALDQHRNPVKRQVTEHAWTLNMCDLPSHPTVDFKYPLSEEAEVDTVFRIRRPVLTRCPEPPYILTEWLESQWQDPFKKSAVKKSIVRYQKDGTSNEEGLSDNPERKAAYDKWNTNRAEWSEREIPVRQSLKIFESVYELHNQLQKESESIEIVLGDGILNWRRKEGGIHYPLLLQRLQLVFKPEIPEFQFIETEQDPELYAALFQSMEGVDGTFISEFHSKISNEKIHPLDGENTSRFLTKLVNRLSSRGKFVGFERLYGEHDEPRIGRAPIIFVRKRTAGFANSLQSILQMIPRSTPDLDSALMNILGIASQSLKLPNQDEASLTAADVLLGKPANPEQIMIARTIDKHAGVLVQGPPGTGKTHTIANLLGHFLAQGKTVLVTSHTTKALRVLRSKMEKELQPLCVSVLDNDAESRTQLQRSVQGIVEQISIIDPDSTAKKITEYENRRNQLCSEIGSLRKDLMRARADEYIEIVVNHKSFSPSEAARFVAKGKANYDWIPGPVAALQSLVLSIDELRELYQTNAQLTSKDEEELQESLPNLSELLSVLQFKELVDRYTIASAAERKTFPVHWLGDTSFVESNQIEFYLNQLEKSLELVLAEEQWKMAALDAGMHGRCGAWNALLGHVQAVISYATDSEVDFVKYHPEIDIPANTDPIVKVFDEIIAHLTKKGSFSKATLWLNPSWKKLIESTKAAGNRPSRVEHFHALRRKVILQTMREELIRIWDSLMKDNGAPDLRDLRNKPEDYACQFCMPIADRLEWHGKVWLPFTEELKGANIKWEAIFADQEPNTHLYGSVMRLTQAVSGPLQEMLLSLQNEVALRDLKKSQETLLGTIRKFEVAGKPSNLIRTLTTSVERLDWDGYRLVFERLYELEQLKPVQERKNLLLELLSKAAPLWSEAIRSRHKSHEQSELPGDVDKAWCWIQLKQELDRRGSISITALQEKIEKQNEEYRIITNQLITLKAWYHQKRRTGLKQQQALVGYAETVKKMGAGTGKRVPQLRAQAMKLVGECRSAVPVWIMPLARVVETFDPASTQFDVVVIDEASQCDVMGLIAFYLAKKVIIVGDHEQVSPLAVGQNLDIVSNLIRQHLVGIPNAALYDGQISIYDLARTSFGGLICLTEHFRCVPEIIQFSNTLSYNGKIKPLRDSSSSDLYPATIAHFVPKAHSTKKLNLVEAEEVARIVIGASKLPEYESKTFGVITMLGEEQAMEIERRLRRTMLESEFNDRKIICGTAAHFQGDERDVMFLSVVEGPADKPPHRMLSFGNMDRFKKRYNVAASRARDQLWVIHSMDPRRDLQPNDLRRRLIEFAENPASFVEDTKKAIEKTDSEFERDVMARLRQRGYRVTPQWKVGHFRIDLVVEGKKDRLAIECDGDKYHPIEKLQEDMARQAMLERLGWKFVRIRGSRYFQDPDEAISEVSNRLAQLNIEPLGGQTITSPSPAEKLLYYKVLEAAEISRDVVDAVNELELEPEPNDENTLLNSFVEIEQLSVAACSQVLSEMEITKAMAIPEVLLDPEPEPLNSPVVSAPDNMVTATKPPRLKVISAPIAPKDNSNKTSHSAAVTERHWIYNSSKDLWYAVSHWAKENGMLDAKERSIAYSIGLGLSKKWNLTDKQLFAAERIYQKAKENGFTEK